MTRIEKILQKAGDDAGIYISSYPNIFYYSAFTSEDAFLYITKDRRILFTDSRYTVQAKEQAKGFEIIDISQKDDIIKKDDKKVICFEEDDISVKAFSSFDKLSKKPRPFANDLREPRKIKDKEEIRRIAEAERLGDEAFSYILTKIKPGKTEVEIASEIEYFMRKNGAEKMSFETVAASGERSAMPHGTASLNVIKKGDLFTLDFGCVVDGYCSDMTRTVVIGEAADWQREIYSVVLAAQKAALDMIGAGKKCSECDRVAREVIEKSGYGKNFGHSTGHSVGIEIHELPALSPKSPDILSPGNCVTVEPGIYIEGMGGVRIEDLVQITSENMVNLTNSKKDLLII